jgi:hypothetical protein
MAPSASTIGVVLYVAARTADVAEYFFCVGLVRDIIAPER